MSAITAVRSSDAMRLAIADPPYLGRAEMFYGARQVPGRMNASPTARIAPVRKADHHPDAAAWDDPAMHAALVDSLVAKYDGWAIAMVPDNLHEYLRWVPRRTRIAVWHDPNVMPTNSHPRRRWEAVLVYVPDGRRRVTDVPGPHVGDVLTVGHGTGFAGAKPSAWSRWVLDMLGYQPGDTVDDLFPGTGGVQTVINAPRLPMVHDPEAGMSADNRPFVTLIHVGGCGGVAFSYREPRQGAPILSADARLNDGTQPDPHQAIICGTCGKPIHPTTDEQLRPEGGW